MAIISNALEVSELSGSGGGSKDDEFNSHCK